MTRRDMPAVLSSLSTSGDWTGRCNLLEPWPVVPAGARFPADIEAASTSL
jgi:hypothetical protein